MKTRMARVLRRSLKLMVAYDLSLAIWLTRNDVIFNNIPTPSFLQVLFRGTLGVILIDSPQGRGSSDDDDDVPMY